MTTNRLIAKLRDACRRFAGAKDGNTVIMFALAFIPLMGLTGAAVDYSPANRLQTAMQAAADATALMVAQSAASQSVDAGAERDQQVLQGHVSATRRRRNLQVTGTYSNTNGSTVHGEGDRHLQDAASWASWAVPRRCRSPPRRPRASAIRGCASRSCSTTPGRWRRRQDRRAQDRRPTNLLDQLKAAATNNGDVYVSIVPFVKDVNVGSGNYSAAGSIGTTPPTGQHIVGCQQRQLQQATPGPESCRRTRLQPRATHAGHCTSTGAAASR